MARVMGEETDAQNEYAFIWDFVSLLTNLIKVSTVFWLFEDWPISLSFLPFADFWIRWTVKLVKLRMLSFLLPERLISWLRECQATVGGFALEYWLLFWLLCPSSRLPSNAEMNCQQNCKYNMAPFQWQHNAFKPTQKKIIQKGNFWNLPFLDDKAWEKFRDSSFLLLKGHLSNKLV